MSHGEGHRGEGHRGEVHQGVGHRGEGHQGKGHRGDCRNLPIQSAAADPHPHPRCFWLPQFLAELAPPGEVVTGSQAPNAPAHLGDESPELVILGEDPGFVAVGQVPEVLAVGYAHASPGLALVA